MTITTQPSGLWRNSGIAAFVSHHVPNTFVRNVRSKISSVSASRSGCGTTVVHPALLTRMSRRPKRSTVASSRAWPDALSEMSACRYSDSPGSDLATAWPASTDDDELTTTAAPSSDSRRADASPIPLDDPVTIATRPSSSPTDTTPSIGAAIRPRPRPEYGALRPGTGKCRARTVPLVATAELRYSGKEHVFARPTTAAATTATA